VSAEASLSDAAQASEEKTPQMDILQQFQEDTMIKLAISGCLGRMGQRIYHYAKQDTDFKTTTLLERAEQTVTTKTIDGLAISSSPDAIKGSDVLIEFTSPEATLEHLAACQKHGVKMVIGTTGMTPEQVEKIKAAAKTIAIVLSSNMSIGVNVCFKLTELLSAKTPSTYNTRIVEAHHIHKKDAPSGTAKTFAERIEKSSTKKVKDIQAIREGEIVGDHKVIFESDEDIIIIEHHAKSRDIFAKGAVVAAKFLADKKNGLFNMQDVLNLA